MLNIKNRKPAPIINYPIMTGEPVVRLRDLAIRDPRRKATLHAILDRMMEHGIFILGHEVDQFEEKLAKFAAKKFAVGVSSASSGLYLALKALGIGPGDEVITTPMSWLMTSSAIELVGATPTFVDVDENFNLDPDRIEEAISPKTKAILPVHFYGRVAQIDRIVEIARQHGLLVIEDVAQAAGASLGGRPMGSFGDAGVFSFSPMKVLGSLGDAGGIVFDDESLLSTLKMLRHCGTVDVEVCLVPEMKHNLDSLQAAVISETLPTAREVIGKRRKFAERYQARLSKLVKCPDLGQPDEHTIYDYTILATRRDGLIRHLFSAGIEVKVRHPILICDQPIYADLPRPDVPRARSFVDQILCLPMHDNLSEKDVDYVCSAIECFYKQSVDA